MSPALEQFVVVLVEPQLAINVGTVLRAMKNMGLSQLRLVRPAPMDLDKTQISAHRTADLLERCQAFDSLEQALADCHHAVAFSARSRYRQWPCYTPRQRMPALFQAAQRAERIAFVFGREQDGLSNEELERCDEIISVPTRADYSSLNLAQAVLIAAYELLLHAQSLEATTEGFAADASSVPQSERVALNQALPAADTQPSTQASASLGQPVPMRARHRLLAQMQFTLDAIGFFKSNANQGVLHTLNTIIHRARLDESEHKLLTGIFVEVLKFALLVRRGLPIPAISVAQPAELPEELLELLEQAT